MASIYGGMAHVTEGFSRALEDNRINEKDAHLVGPICRSIDELQAALAAARAQLIEATGYNPGAPVRAVGGA